MSYVNYMSYARYMGYVSYMSFVSHMSYAPYVYLNNWPISKIQKFLNADYLPRFANSLIK